MALKFYALSGSPFAWKVWLTLEHKRLSYELHMLSISAGDLKKPEFLALTPRGKVPVIVHDGFVLYESSAIVEYLDEVSPEHPAIPLSAPRAGIARRIAAEAEAYVYPQVRIALFETLMRREGEPDMALLDAARTALTRELSLFERYIEGPFFLGDTPTIADFALYPQLALLARIERKQPRYGMDAIVPKGVAAWMKTVESLPYFDRTTPPHWKDA